MNFDIIQAVEVFHTIIIPLFVFYLIYKADMRAFREFVDALHCPGASVLVGYVLIVTGIVMMKIMLVDDGKYIIGAGGGILAKSLAGGTAPTSSEATPTPDKPVEATQ